MSETFYQTLAQCVGHIQRIDDVQLPGVGAQAQLLAVQDALSRLIRELLDDLRGNGFDRGVTLALDESSDTELVLDIPYHPMNADGYYMRWQEFIAIITPTFLPEEVKVVVKSPRSKRGPGWKDHADFIGDKLNDMARVKSKITYVERVNTALDNHFAQQEK